MRDSLLLCSYSLVESEITSIKIYIASNIKESLDHVWTKKKKTEYSYFHILIYRRDKVSVQNRL